MTGVVARYVALSLCFAAAAGQAGSGVFDGHTADLQLAEETLVKEDAPVVEFGLFDAAEKLSGWRLASAADLVMFKAEFVAQYNSNRGIRVAKRFSSGNCCIALRGDVMLTITGSKYGFQFPMVGNKVACNPKGGYDPALPVQFYGIAALPTSVELGAKKTCVVNHNPGIFLRVPSRIEFALYDHEKDPGQGWHLMSAEDFSTYKGQFIKQYNSLPFGIPSLREGWMSGNCCVAVKGGKKLVISGTPYAYQFVASPTTGAPVCNPASGYTTGNFAFYKSGQLKPDMVFDSKTACATNHNPGVFMRALVGTNDPLQFGLYDLHAKPPGGGWQLATAADVEGAKKIFIDAYNANGGLHVVAPFQSGNCCIAVKGGMKLVVTGTPYGYQFPASASGGIRCNPTGGYAERVYQFYRTPTLKADVVFTEKAACSTNHNPAIYIRKAAATSSLLQWWDLGDPQVDAQGRRWAPTPSPTEPPLDCVVTEWDAWNPCSRTCGTGSRSRARTVSTTPLRNGKACPALIESEPCADTACPIDCIVSEWTSWSACSTSCGVATMSRQRGIDTETLYGGKACPQLAQTQGCASNAPCPVNCEVSVWSALSPCTATCGSGTQERKRMVVREPANGGVACGELTQSSTCDAGACPVHCVVSSYGEWTTCSLPCGTGQQERARIVATAAAHGGTPCPVLRETQLCNATPCPVDCVVGEWHLDIPCTKTCGGGKLQNRRAITQPARHSGKACPSLIKEHDCNTGPCPVHCSVSSFSEWAACSVTCGGGSQLRTRTVTKHAQHGGYTCPVLEEEQRCATLHCPVDCVVGAWSVWDDCSKSCGGGEQQRSRAAGTPAQYGGKQCTALSEKRACAASDCPVDCAVGDWGEWTSCSLSCGAGKRTATRKVMRNGGYGGAGCPDLHRSETCNDKACPTDCAMGAWGAWSDCTRTCGSGFQHRQRLMTVAPLHGGIACPDALGTRSCAELPCPVDCALTEWGAFSMCSVTCGKGSKTRQRSVDRKPAAGGVACGSLTNAADCSGGACPVHCEMGSWSAWSACTATCGAGHHHRERSIVKESKYGGLGCPATKEDKPCTQQDCPVHCKVSAWGGYSDCNAKCGSGSMTRHRIAVQQPKYNGNHCPHMSETHMCNIHPCPTHCKVSEWSAWSMCNARCNGGMRWHSREIVIDAKYDGRPCPNLRKEEMCNTKKCPVNCMTSHWGAWSTCDRTCGGGQQKQVRRALSEAKSGGVPCSLTELEKTRPCSTAACPVDLFGIYDYDAKQPPVGGPWKLMSAKDMEHFKAELVATYNHHGGIKVIAPWVGHSCCFSLRSGKKLTISNTHHAYAPFQFPGTYAPKPGDAAGDPPTAKLVCNPKQGYGVGQKGNILAFYGVAQLGSENTFGEGYEPNCHNNHNPGLWMSANIFAVLGKATPAPTPAANGPKVCSHMQCTLSAGTDAHIVIRHHRNEQNGLRHWCRMDRPPPSSFTGKAWPKKKTCSCVCHTPSADEGRNEWMEEGVWHAAIAKALLAEPAAEDDFAESPVFGAASLAVGMGAMALVAWTLRRGQETAGLVSDGWRRQQAAEEVQSARNAIFGRGPPRSYGSGASPRAAAEDEAAEDSEAEEEVVDTHWSSSSSFQKEPSRELGALPSI